MSNNIIEFVPPTAASVRQIEMLPNREDEKVIEVLSEFINRILYKGEEKIIDTFWELRRKIFAGIFMTIDEVTNEYRIYVLYKKGNIKCDTTYDRQSNISMALTGLTRMAEQYSLNSELRISFRCEDLEGIVNCATDHKGTISSYGGLITDHKEAPALRDLKNGIIIIGGKADGFDDELERIELTPSINNMTLRLKNIKNKVKAQTLDKEKTRIHLQKK